MTSANIIFESLPALYVNSDGQPKEIRSSLQFYVNDVIRKIKTSDSVPTKKGVLDFVELALRRNSENFHSWLKFGGSEFGETYKYKLTRNFNVVRVKLE